jgi:adenylate cyclase
MPENPLPKYIQKRMKVTTADEMWYKLLTEGDPYSKWERMINALFPSNPRCAMCYSPFGGIGGALARLGFYFTSPSPKNPRFCTACNLFHTRYPGGAELELTMLFVDVRGSTSIAEKMNAVEFGQLMNRFYDATINVLVQADAFIDKLVGDEVTAHFFPGYTGPEHARKAVQAGQALLRVTGHADPGGPWVPVGVGVHTGTAWVGSIIGASGSGSDFTALGDNVNVAARLASKAAAGEVLISQATASAARIDTGGLEGRQLELKGKSELFPVFVLGAGDE